MLNETIPQATTPPPASLSKREFARRHSVSERTVDYWRERGMPCLLVSRRKVLFPVAQADSWITEKFLVSRRVGGAR